MLDDINAILDTAIYLSNKGNLTKASHYLEVVLFGSTKINNDVLVDLDLNQFRSSANKLPYDESEGRELLGSVYYRETNDADAEYLYAPVFGRAQSDKGYAQGSIDHYLAYKFPNYNMDPNITNWILNLRNGLSEYTTETRGNQRWRNVTEEENAGEHR